MTGANRTDAAVREYARTLAGPAGRTPAGVGAARHRLDAPPVDPGVLYEGMETEGVRVAPPPPAAARAARRKRERRREESEGRSASWWSVMVWIILGMAVVRSIDACSKPKPPPPWSAPVNERFSIPSFRDRDQDVHELAERWRRLRVGTGSPPTAPRREGR